MIKQLLICLAIFLFLINDNLHAQTRLLVTPSYKQIALTNQTVVQLNLETVVNLYAASVTILYDHNVVNYSGMVNGNVLSGLVFSNHTTNSITIDLSNVNLNQFSGSGIMFSVTFTAVGLGTSPVTISDVKLRDNNNNVLPVDTSLGSINVTGPTTSLSISPVSQIVKGAGTVSVQILVDNASNLHSASVTIGFDSTILRYSSVSNGTFLQSNSMGYSVFMYKTLYPNSASPNQVKVDQAILGNASVTGSGLLFTINFTTNHSGQTPISIDDFVLLDLNSNVISATPISGSVIVSTNLSPRVFLQSLFNGTTMNTTLNSLSYLPLNQPYSGAPWNYRGSESVAAGFFSTHRNIADWILIELRSGISGGSLVSKRAAFLLNNGNIVDLDGSSSLSFPGTVAGNYYIVIRHRFTLETWSANTQALDCATISYDFTTSATQAFGGNMILKGGKYCLYSGDVNQDGLVDSGDILLIDNDYTNYLFGPGLVTDVNGDGVVDSGDILITDNNYTNYIFSAKPAGAPGAKHITRTLRVKSQDKTGK